MDPREFQNQLNNAHKLMLEEKYEDAIIILEKLKDIDKQSDFEYNLTHQLFQLFSNAHSLYNQQKIKDGINAILMKQKVWTISKLNRLLKERIGLELDDKTFQKELELLILRGLISCSIEGDLVIF